MKVHLVRNILSTLFIATLSQLCTGAKLDSIVGSSWHTPTSTTRNLLAPSDSKESSPYYNYRIASGNDQSSFLPTNAVSNFEQISNNWGRVGENAKLFQRHATGESSNSQYQHYYQYHPDSSSYGVVPEVGNAEQRHEYPDSGIPNNFNLLSVGGIGSPPLDLVDPATAGGSIFDNLPTFSGITSSIWDTASNLAESFGLGGLGITGSLIVLALGGPLLVFAILFPTAILIVSILGFPVLQLTLPPAGFVRSLKGGMADKARIARDVLQSEECIERLSCKLLRKTRKLPYENFILEKLSGSENEWAARISKSVKIGREGQDCDQFKCSYATKKLKEVYDIFRNRK